MARESRSFSRGLNPAMFPNGHGPVRPAVFCGDSIMQGYGLAGGEEGTADRIARIRRWTGTNIAAGSAQMITMVDAIYIHELTRAANERGFILTGYNDMRNYGTNADKQGLYGEILEAAVASLSIPEAKKMYALAASETGTWTSYALYGAWGKDRAGTTSAVATYTVTGSHVYICVTGSVSAGTVDVTVDAVSHGSIVCGNANYSSVAGRHYGPKLLKITGLSAGAHTVVLTQHDDSYIFGEWVAGFEPSDCLPVYVGNCLKMNTTGYALGNPDWDLGSDTAVSQFNAVIAAKVAALVADGLPVSLVDADAVYDPDTADVQADNAHPSEAGHAKIADAFIESCRV